MRILYVVHQFYPEFASGTERVTLNLARMAQRAGHRVQVLACMVDPSRHQGMPCAVIDDALETVIDGVPVMLLDRASLPAQAETTFDVAEPMAAQIAQWIQDRGFEVMHLMHSMRMSSAILATQRAGLPMVATLTDFFPACLRINLLDADGRACNGPDGGRQCAKRCAPVGWDESALQARYEQARSMLACASSLVAPSAFVAGRYADAFPGLRVEVIPHGVDLLALAQGASSKADVGRQLRPLRLGFLGSLIEPKGLHVLLLALASLRGLPLLLRVGGGFFGDVRYRDKLHALAAADDRVELLGQIPAGAVGDFLRGIDLLCLPSLVPESFSLVVHEGAAVGVPSLVSDLGAPAQTVRRSGAGAVVASGNASAWADAIRRCVEAPALVEQWRHAIRLPQRIEEEAFFYEGLYRRALGVRA